MLDVDEWKEWFNAENTHFLADKASPPDDEWFMGTARLVALRYGGESASVPACFCDGTGTLYRLFSVT